MKRRAVPLPSDTKQDELLTVLFTGMFVACC